MTVNTLGTYYRRPMLREGVSFEVSDDAARISYDEVTLELEMSEQARPFVTAFMEGVKAGVPSSALAASCTGVEEHAVELLETLDRYGFLTEAEISGPSEYVTGSQYWLEVSAFASRHKTRLAAPLYPALESGRFGRAGLIAYAIQYYHIVSAGPAIISGMLAHVADSETRRILSSFLQEELGHEDLLLSALTAAGLSREEVETTLPLPETFGIISLLQVMADQEPLSFKAAIFLMEEETGAFHRALVSRCQAEGLGEGFWKPILEHAHINDGGDHGSISEQLLAREDAISTEARLVGLRQVYSLIDALVSLEHALLVCDSEGRRSFVPPDLAHE